MAYEIALLMGDLILYNSRHCITQNKQSRNNLFRCCNIQNKNELTIFMLFTHLYSLSYPNYTHISLINLIFQIKNPNFRGWKRP